MGLGSDPDDLIGRIYEAGVVPELWPDVLRELAHATGLHGGMLFTIDARGGDSRSVTVGDAVVEAMRRFVLQGWAERNTRAARLAPMRYPGFATDHDLFTEEELDADPFYTEFLRPLGIGWAVGTHVPAPSGDIIVFNMEGWYKDGPIGRDVVHFFDALRPHLARAGLLSARTRLEQVRAAVEMLGMVGLPAAAVGRDGRLLPATNLLFDALIPDTFHDRRSRLALADQAADSLFAKACATLNTVGTTTVRSIPVRARDEQPAMVVHLTPIRGAAHDIFLGAAAVVLVTPVVKGEVPSTDVLSGLFDLTPAEARVARGIVAGQTVEAISLDAGVSRETVRAQLKATLAKTGLHRQAELTRLLAGTAVPKHPTG